MYHLSYLMQVGDLMEVKRYTAEWLFLFCVLFCAVPLRVDHCAECPT